jgi:hypothetical protein
MKERHPELKAWIGAIIKLVEYVCEEMHAEPRVVLKAILMHFNTRNKT